MTKEEILQYVLESPENTNPNVLRGMLDKIDSESQVGYKVNIINNSEHTIAAIPLASIEENVIYGSLFYEIEPNSTLSKTLIDIYKENAVFNSIELHSEYDFGVICSTNNWQSAYLGLGWSFYYESTTPNTEDITITITEPNIIFQDIVMEGGSGVNKIISPAIVTFEEGKSYTFFISFNGENYKGYNLTAAINNGILYWGPTPSTSFTNPMPRIEYNPETNTNNFTALPKGSAIPTGTYTMYVAT